MPRHNLHEPSDEVMYVAASEILRQGCFISRELSAPGSNARGRSRFGRKVFRDGKPRVARAYGRAASAPRQGKQIAIDSSGIRHAPARARNERSAGSRWLGSPE